MTGRVLFAILGFVALAAGLFTAAEALVSRSASLLLFGPGTAGRWAGFGTGLALSAAGVILGWPWSRPKRPS